MLIAVILIRVVPTLRHLTLLLIALNIADGGLRGAVGIALALALDNEVFEVTGGDDSEFNTGVALLTIGRRSIAFV